MQKTRATEFFKDWESALIWSCLQGYMGRLIADDEENIAAAMIDIGDFCYLAGEPSVALLQKISGEKLLIPKDSAWEPVIESYFGKRCNKTLRYAIKKEPNIFDKNKLTAFANSILPCYEIRMIDEELFDMTKNWAWSVDLCSQFLNYADFKKLAIGVGILHKGELVAGASPYAVYNGGIEIEIDTKPEFRRKGLATACGARLILECQARDIYPSWDAYDLRSVALAEKLGYHRANEYVTYETISI